MEFLEWIGGHWSRPISCALIAWALAYGYRGGCEAMCRSESERVKARYQYLMESEKASRPR